MLTNSALQITEIMLQQPAKGMFDFNRTEYKNKTAVLSCQQSLYYQNKKV